MQRKISLFVALCALVVTSVLPGTSIAQQMEVDRSGKGAVLCNWLIMVDTRNEIDICYPGQYGALRSELSASIDAINSFIVANSPTPITKSALEEIIAKRLADARAKTAAGVNSTVNCKSDRSTFLEPMAKRSHEDWQRWVADFLSVPRKPLMNPCL